MRDASRSCWMQIPGSTEVSILVIGLPTRRPQPIRSSNEIVESVQMINQDMHKNAFLLLVGNDAEQCCEDQNNVDISDCSRPRSSAAYLLTIYPVWMRKMRLPNIHEAPMNKHNNYCVLSNDNTKKRRAEITCFFHNSADRSNAILQKEDWRAALPVRSFCSNPIAFLAYH